jgi:phosphatidate phosphatase APP1
VISDVDDTVKVSQVRDRRELLANTFLRAFRGVPGMAEAYRQWAADGAAFHYVSASPWQLYAPLARFLAAERFPEGSFHLKLFRVKDSSFFDLYANPEVYKRRTIEPILKTYPRRKFVLVGDSGEEDPEIYGALAREHPGQIVRILIRDVTGEQADAERYRIAFRGVEADRWMVFREASGIQNIALP